MVHGVGWDELFSSDFFEDIFEVIGLVIQVVAHINEAKDSCENEEGVKEVQSSKWPQDVVTVVSHSLDQRIPMEHERRGIHVFPIRPNKHSITGVSAVFSGANQEESSQSANDARPLGHLLVDQVRQRGEYFEPGFLNRIHQFN